MDELEQTWPDADRRDDALERLLVRVHEQRVELRPSQVLLLKTLSHGLTEREAAVVLGWSFASVHDQAKAARRALVAKSTLHAVATALRLGLIS